MLAMIIRIIEDLIVQVFYRFKLQPKLSKTKFIFNNAFINSYNYKFNIIGKKQFILVYLRALTKGELNLLL